MNNHGPVPKKAGKKRRIAKFGPRLRSLEDRFLEKLSSEGDCVVFTGTKNNYGYGMLYDRDTGKKELAHRVALRVRDGKYPTGTVRHTCDNPACVKLAHLVEGTQAENLEDMRKKGRHKYVAHLGEKNGFSKLTDKQVRRMKRLLRAGTNTQAEIAAIFDVSQALVNHVNTGRAWRHIQ